ncbi:MAG: hypothetical protein HYZ01_14015 [Ignavibacteriales bacterium]|nr:hypothetical protein [Ignavibacteriales bacterium]
MKRLETLVQKVEDCVERLNGFFERTFHNGLVNVSKRRVVWGARDCRHRAARKEQPLVTTSERFKLQKGLRFLPHERNSLNVRKMQTRVKKTLSKPTSL